MKEMQPNPSTVRRIIYLVVRLTLGAVFLYAGYRKILNPGAFTQAIFNYQILPDGLVNLAALILPWLELLLGLCLLVGYWMPGATLLGAALLTIFLAALAYNRIRGLDIHCGCFSADTTAGPADLRTVARDLLFWAMSIYLIYGVLRGRFGEARNSRSPVEK